MKVFTASFLLLAVVVVAAVAKKSEDDAWKEYKTKYGKVHKDAKEEAKRKTLFVAVHRKIEEHNKGNSSWKMGHNLFSDWTAEEKKRLTGRQSASSRTEVSYEFSNEISTRQLPASIDYRNDACLGPVKHQGECGSCWAFSSMVPLEFQLCKSKKAYIALSEQQLVNCACGGCNGGDYYPAWQYLSTTSAGIVASTVLTYSGSQATCQTFTSGLIKPVSWARVASSPSSIMAALKTYGPMSIAMDVKDSFYNYESGVYEADDCGNAISDLNHAMAMVGYGEDSATGLGYWVIRNSWGAQWAEDGYMRVRRGTNVCGVEADVGYVKTNLALSSYA